MTNFDDIALQTIERYSKRYRQMGRNIRTLGWGSIDQQQYRFERTLDAADPHNQSVLDIGCGFADLLNFYEKSGIVPSHYTGWDLNPDFIKECQSGKRKNTTFKVADVSRPTHSVETSSFDIAIMLGLLNFNLGNTEKNMEFSRALIQNAFSLVKGVLVVDFLSAHLTSDYPREDFVFYHQPAEMLEFALSLTPNVELQHNYAPIPQKEFMLFIYK